MLIPVNAAPLLPKSSSRDWSLDLVEEVAGGRLVVAVVAVALSGSAGAHGVKNNCKNIGVFN